MKDFFAISTDFNLLSTTVRLLLALILGGFIGFDRGRRGRAAGFRTHILVCIGSCMASMTGLYVSEILAMTNDPTRIAAQVISGIGFLGVGTILVTGGFHVRGLTTAAGLWSTAAIGLCLGYGFYYAAILCTLLLVVVIALLHRFDTIFITNSKNTDVYLEVEEVSKINSVIQKIKSYEYKTKDIEVCPARSNTPSAVGIDMTIESKGKEQKKCLLDILNEIDGIIFIIQRD